MYGAIYKCKMCGKEFPYINPGEKEEMEKFDLQKWTFTPYGAPFPENRILGRETDSSTYIPHYCNDDENAIGLAELIGFREMTNLQQCKKNWKVMNNLQKQSILCDEFDFHGVEENEYLPIVDFILKDGFDMTGWRLNEIPTAGQYCFFREDTNQCFDINANKGIITAQYMDSIDGKYYMFNAESIEDAVSRYNLPEAVILPINPDPQSEQSRI